MNTFTRNVWIWSNSYLELYEQPGSSQSGGATGTHAHLHSHDQGEESEVSSLVDLPPGRSLGFIIISRPLQIWIQLIYILLTYKLL